MKNIFSEHLRSGLSQKEIVQGLRKILYPDIEDTDVEIITICLLCHLLIENEINSILFRWLKYDMPSREGFDEKKIEDDLWKEITNFSFSVKFKILQPVFSAHFNDSNKFIWKINDLRNDIFHGRAVKNAKFNGKSVKEEGVIENLFTTTQEIVHHLEVFDELLDSRRAQAEKLTRKLENLGQPLL